jgi:hypothetical protein
MFYRVDYIVGSAIVAQVFGVIFFVGLGRCSQLSGGY